MRLKACRPASPLRHNMSWGDLEWSFRGNYSKASKHQAWKCRMMDGFMDGYGWIFVFWISRIFWNNSTFHISTISQSQTNKPLGAFPNPKKTIAMTQVGDLSNPLQSNRIHGWITSGSRVPTIRFKESCTSEVRPGGWDENNWKLLIWIPKARCLQLTESLWLERKHSEVLRCTSKIEKGWLNMAKHVSTDFTYRRLIFSHDYKGSRTVCPSSAFHRGIHRHPSANPL